jgi:hypothetical protein
VAIGHCEALISTATSTESSRAPLIPTTLAVKFPVDAVLLAAIVKVEDATMFGLGVTGLWMFSVTPAGLVDSHETESVTVELDEMLYRRSQTM